MSKYEMIYSDLKSKIDSKYYLANSYLPSENELMKIYNASRDTIRKALAQLLQDGYIQKNKGKGSLVLNRNKIAFPISGLTSFKELSLAMKEEVETSVEYFKIEEATEQLKKELHMQNGKVYHIERVRKINHEKVILDIDYINSSLIPGLTQKLAMESIYEYIEGELELKISFAQKEITVVKATEKEKQLLDLLDYDFLVCVKSYCYLDDATLFQYTESKHRPDKFRFVEFARRSHLFNKK